MLSTALGQDATQLAATEKRMLLSRLLARLAHEIRNPLSSLDVHIQLLEEDLAGSGAPLKETTASRLEIIRAEMRRLETTVQHFLRLAGTSHVELERVNLPALCEHVCRLLRPEAEAHAIALDFEVEAGLPPFLADPGQLTQALLNLVINALQAVGQSGRVHIDARRTEPGAVRIEVWDSGPGVPAELHASVFDPYFTTKPDGTGLGLWIVQQILAAHGGTVHVATCPGGGASFTLRLPLRRAETDHG
ncbi:MAG: hypothetical protein JXQ71_01895 [Verrucomicrobia bacterium]|nr:hypothetical protein [Verrucomicrobiota bacterium]